VNPALRRWMLAATPVIAALALPGLLVGRMRREREEVDRVVGRNLALHRVHYSEPGGIPVTALRAQADKVSTSITAGYRAFLERYALERGPEHRLPEGVSLPALAFKEAIIRFRERNAARMQRVSLTGSFNTTSFSDLRPEVLEESLVQAAAAEAFLDLVEGLPIAGVSARVASGRPRRARAAEIFDGSLVCVSVQAEFRASLAGLEALLDRIAGTGGPFVVERLGVENPFEAEPERRSAELRCRVDLVALSGGLLDEPRYGDERPGWVREVEGL
jgi:hypothetical protein